MLPTRLLTSTALALIAMPAAARAQTTLDRVDPARIEATSPRDVKPVADLPTQTIAPAPAATSDAAAPVTVGAVQLVGLERLRPSDFADIFELYVGRTVSPGALAGLADAIAERARARGLPFASAAIGPQTLTAGVLRITVDEGRIDEIRLKGSDNQAVRAALMPLVGAPATLAELERRLLIAGDVDGIWLRGTRFVREGARGVLVVDLLPGRVVAYAGIDNSGSRPIGPIQADLSVRIAQVFADDDVLTFTALATPTQPDEFGYGRLRYAKRVSITGTEVSVALSYSRSHPGAYLLSRDIDGATWSGQVGLLQPLIRRRHDSLWLEASAAVRNVTQDREGDRVRRDRLTVARVGLNGFTDLAGGRLRSGLTIGHGFDLFGATRLGDPQASRRDASGVFTSVQLVGDWTSKIASGFSTQIAFASQLADRSLLVSEETGLGGGSFLRAYDYSERSGDEGAMAALEERYDVPIAFGPVSKPQLYVFADGGTVRNIDSGLGDGSLFSAGGGVRAAVKGLATVDVGIAVPLSGVRYDAGNSAPVINFRISRRL